MFSTDLSWTDGPVETFGQRKERKGRDREGTVPTSSSTPSRSSSSQTRSSRTFSSHTTHRKLRSSGASVDGSTAISATEPEQVRWSPALAPFNFIQTPAKTIRAIKCSNRPSTTASSRSAASSAISSVFPKQNSSISMSVSVSSINSAISTLSSGRPRSAHGASSSQQQQQQQQHHHAYTHIPHLSAAWGSIRSGLTKKKHQQFPSADYTGTVDCRELDTSASDIVAVPPPPSRRSTQPSSTTLGPKFEDDRTVRNRSTLHRLTATVGTRDEGSPTTQQELRRMDNCVVGLEPVSTTTVSETSIMGIPSCASPTILSFPSPSELSEHDDMDPIKLCQSYEKMRQAVFALQVRNTAAPPDRTRLSPRRALSNLDPITIPFSYLNRTNALDNHDVGLQSLRTTNPLAENSYHPTRTTPLPLGRSATIDFGDLSIQPSLPQHLEVLRFLPPSSPILLLSSFLVSIHSEISPTDVLQQIGTKFTLFSTSHGFHLTPASTLSNDISVLMMLEMKCVDSFALPRAPGSHALGQINGSSLPDPPFNPHQACILELDGSIAETYWSSALFQGASIQHLVTASSNGPGPYQLPPNSPLLPIHVSQVTGRSILPLPFPTGKFQLARCSRLPVLFQASSIPHFFSEIYRVLSPGGYLELRLVEPLPVRGSVGPKLQAWLEEHLELNLEANFRCQRPGVLVPNWATQSGFKIIQFDESLDTQSRHRTPRRLGTRTIRLPTIPPNSTDEDRSSEGNVGPKSTSLIGSKLLRELWKSNWSEMLDFPPEVRVGSAKAESGPTTPLYPAPINQNVNNEPNDGFQSRPPFASFRASTLPISPSHSLLHSGSVKSELVSIPEPDVQAVPTAIGYGVQDNHSMPPTESALFWWYNVDILNECREWGTVWDVTQLWLQKE